MRILLLALLSVALCFAQDTTCNSGDILWVSETVTADTDIAAGGAEYNNSATPFGIQGAFDAVNLCLGARIRILYGANNYGPSSNSWTNRIDSTKEIDVVFDADTNGYRSFIWVEGWADTSNQCGTSGYEWTTECPVTLDFDRANITGDDGFDISSAGDGYVWNWIRVINVDGAGWRTAHPNTEDIHFNSVAVENATITGIVHTDHTTVYNSYFYNTGTQAMSVRNYSSVVGSIIDCGGSGVGINNAAANSIVALLYNNVIRNCDDAVSFGSSDSWRVIRNTFAGNVDCITSTGSYPQNNIIVDNLFEECSGGTAVELFPADPADAVLLISGNVYPASGSQMDILDTDTYYVMDPHAARSNGAAVITGCTLTGATDETLDATACGESVVLPNGELASQDRIVPGIAYERLDVPASGGGGEHSYVTIQ